MITTFGEVMLRLKSSGFERLMQSPFLEATFGGGDANVAVSLANYGEDVSYITILPDNDIGKACIRELRGFGVKTDGIITGPGRMGIYYLEAGVNQRPSKVIYDREGSAIATAAENAIDWDKAIEGVDWLHITGITPAISASAAAMCEKAAEAAKKRGATFSCDLNYRKSLWKYGVRAYEFMPRLMEMVDVCIANEEDFQNALGIASDIEVESGTIDIRHIESLLERVFEQYPHLRLASMTLRESKSASHNDWSACLSDGRKMYISKKYEIRNIVDRVGGGDSFSAGLIYALNHYEDKQDVIEFAAAASCLKHSVPGDYNRVTVQEVEQFMKSGGSGRISR
jgi:Sugar kinases, ribokinase family